MDKEIKAKWLTALRSGEYKQTKRVLNDGKEGFCCLGVLCEVHRKETGEGSWVDDKSDDDLPCLGYMGETMVLPLDIVSWAGLPEDGGRNPPIGKDSLAELNDKGMSFAEIADIIEANF